jgi:hypothetical protein
VRSRDGGLTLLTRLEQSVNCGQGEMDIHIARRCGPEGTAFLVWKMGLWEQEAAAQSTLPPGGRAHLSPGTEEKTSFPGVWKQAGGQWNGWPVSSTTCSRPGSSGYGQWPQGTLSDLSGCCPWLGAVTLRLGVQDPFLKWLSSQRAFVYVDYHLPRETKTSLKTYLRWQQ